MKNLPDFVRYFLRDFIEAAIVSLLALAGFGDFQAALHAALISIGVAAIAAARRNLGRFITYLNDFLGTTPNV